jgi:membrane protease YdiL (CAAX protease family)
MSKEKKRLKTVLVLFIVTILYTIYRYQGSAYFFISLLDTPLRGNRELALPVYYQWVMAFFLLGVIPMLTVRFGFKERLSKYGFSLKRPLFTLLITLLGIAIITPLVYIGARSPELSSLYPLAKSAGDSPGNFLKSALFYLLYYVGYEFCFRGFLFMGIKDDIGEWQALGVSLIATVLLHVNKPQSETVMAIIAGIAFPIIVSRLGSLLPVILIHAYAGISLDYWVIIQSGGFR